MCETCALAVAKGVEKPKSRRVAKSRENPHRILIVAKSTFSELLQTLGLFDPFDLLDLLDLLRHPHWAEKAVLSWVVPQMTVNRGPASSDFN